MRLFLFLLLLTLAAGVGPARAQNACRHDAFESAPDARRREEALAAARMINHLAASPLAPRIPATYPAWNRFAELPALATLRGMGGPAGELARKIDWGGDEPLPGWRIHHVAGAEGYAFTLLDTRDPCGFTYASNDTGVIVEGRVLAGARRGLRPIVPTARF